MRGDDHVVVSLEGDLSGTDLAQTVGCIHVEGAAQGTHLVARPVVSFPQGCQSLRKAEGWRESCSRCDRQHMLESGWSCLRDRSCERESGVALSASFGVFFNVDRSAWAGARDT